MTSTSTYFNLLPNEGIGIIYDGSQKTPTVTNKSLVAPEFLNFTSVSVFLLLSSYSKEKI